MSTHLLLLMYTAAGAVIFTVIALLSILSYVGFRSRIPLVSLLLQVVMDITKHHKTVYVVALITLLLQASLSVYGAAMLVQWIYVLVGVSSGGTRSPLSLRMAPKSMV